MPSPEVAGESEDESEAPSDGGMDEAAFTVGEADLGVDSDDDIVSGFDGVEDDEEEGEESSESTSSGGSSGGSTDINIESTIEDGLAEAAAVGLEGDERDNVRREMKAVASKFKVGYFGSQVATKYLKRDIEDIPAEYGLAASLIAFGAIAIYKRPDGEERIRKGVQKVRDSFGGDEEPAAPTQPRQPPQQPRQQPAQAQTPQQARQATPAERVEQSGQGTPKQQSDVAEVEEPAPVDGLGGEEADADEEEDT